MPIIEVENLHKHYTVAEKEAGLKGSLRSFFSRKTKTVRAVDGVSFALEAGEMVGFLGANGAGKTTTLKMLSGLLHPSSGRVTVAGQTPYQRKASFLRNITLVMGQKQQLMWDLPALDSFLVNAAIYEIPEAHFQATLKEYSDILELDGLLSKQVRKLSLGERMKCELTAALLHQPKVLFLDEPTIGLDVNMQVRIREFVAEYNRKFEATVILTSHYMADVTALCSRIVVVDKGKVVLDGSIDKLLERATDKIVGLEFSSRVEREVLERYGQVQSLNGLNAKLLIPRAQASVLAARVLTELPVADVTIEDPPIEELIGQIFSEGKASREAELERVQKEEVRI